MPRKRGETELAIFTLHFAALLVTAILLGGMAFFSFLLSPALFMRLSRDEAGRVVGHLFPFYYGAGAVLALLGSVLANWSFAGLALGLTGIAFLFALFWLRPSINRSREKGRAGDEVALGVFKAMHRASVALNLLQIVAVFVAFVLLAGGFERV
jgi:hypothetical protein